MLQFGGHHLALNITIDGERGILTPTLTGAQPSLYTLNGRPCGRSVRRATRRSRCSNALDENQRKQAILSYRLADLVLGPGQDGKTIQPEGLKASNMSEKQRAMLHGLIAEWAGIVHESAAAARMAELKADINETWFAWSGPIDRHSGKQYRGVLPDSGAASGDRVRAAADGRRSLDACAYHVPRSNQRLRPEARCKMKPTLSAAAILLLAGRRRSRTGSTSIFKAQSSRSEKNRVDAQMTLTPGVAVFATLIADIDTDANGVISEPSSTLMPIAFCGIYRSRLMASR